MISIRSEYELSLLKEAGHIVYLTHQYLKQYIKPGITTKELDKLAEDFIRSKGATPSFLNYNGFPGSICTSINNEVVHGIPSKRKLRNGDIISIDIGACYKGYHGDSAWSYGVGTISKDMEYLLKHTEEALYVGLKEVKPGARIGDIGAAIEEYANKHGLNYVCDSSNEDTRYARNLIRKEILPLMQKINPDVIDAASNLIKLSNMHSRIISNSLECVKNELLTDKNEIFLDKFLDLDESLKFEIMNDFLACELKNRDYSRIKSYVDFVLRGGRRKSLNGKVFLEVCGNKIFKTRVCEKKLTEIKITGPGVYDFEGIKDLIEKVSSKCDFKNKNGVKYLNLDFKDGITLRTRRDGDVFSPCGMKNGKMKLKKYLINEKIPRQMRDNLLLLANKDEILCILGIQISQKVVVAENTSCYRVKISE